MKTLTVGILIIFCIFVMLVSIYSEVKDYNRTQQSTIDGLKLKIILTEQQYLKALDSIQALQLRQSDSTKFYKSQKEKDQKSVTTKTEKHETIVFVNLNDSARHSKLAKLFSSYKHP